MRRRNFCSALLSIPAAAQQYAVRTRGLSPIAIRAARVITTSPEGRYQWAFLKLETSEPGLYGIGSASNLFHCAAIATAVEKTYAPFWIGKNPDRIEDLWQSTNVRSYWRNSTIQNNVLGALDMALWDIKGKRAGMPVYDMLGGKARDGVPVYDHQGGKTKEECLDTLQKSLANGFTHVRIQLGGYGGGGL